MRKSAQIRKRMKNSTPNYGQLMKLSGYKMPDPDYTTPELTAGSTDSQWPIVRAGDNNLYFQEMAALAQRSGIGRACVETRAHFIRGDGLHLCPAKNEGEGAQATPEAILSSAHFRAVCMDLALFGGFALHMRFDAGGRLRRLDAVDYANVRLESADEHGHIPAAWVSADWSRARSRRHPYAAPIRLPLWRAEASTKNLAPPDVRKTGALLYVKPYYPGAFYYAPPIWAAAADRMIADAEIGRFHARNVANGFFPGMMLYLPGTDWDSADPESGLSKKERFQAWFDNNYGGPDNAGKVLKLYGESREHVPQPINFQPQVNGDMLLSLENNTLRYIPIAFRVPPVIAGIAEPGRLGQTQQLLDELEMFQNNVIAPEQELLCSALKEIWPLAGRGSAEIMVRQRKPLSYMPPAAIAVMTEEEIRRLSGLSHTVGG